IAPEAALAQPSDQIVEPLGGDRIQKRLPVGVVAIDRHSRDSDGLGDSTHADRLNPTVLQYASGCDQDLLVSRRSHVYTVYMRSRQVNYAEGFHGRCANSRTMCA